LKTSKLQGTSSHHSFVPLSTMTLNMYRLSCDSQHNKVSIGDEVLSCDNDFTLLDYCRSICCSYLWWRVVYRPTQSEKNTVIVK